MSIANDLLNLYTDTDAALKHCNEKLTEKRAETATTLYEVADKISTIKADYGKLIDGTVKEIIIDGYKDNYATVYEIRPYAFYNCKSLETARLPGMASKIGDYAFYGCSSMDLIPFDTFLTKIGDYAFYGCSELTRIPYTSYLTSIGDYAFCGCTNIETINLYGIYDVTVGNHAFEDCVNLTAINVEDATEIEIKTIGDYAFAGCTSLTTVDGLTYCSVGDYAFSECRNLTKVNCGDVGDYVFDGCTSLTSVSTNLFTENSFKNCPSLTRVNCSCGNVVPPSNAFADLKLLKKITLRGEFVNEGVLNGCSSVTEIRLDNPVSIEDGAFSDCSSLTALIFTGINNPLPITSNTLAGTPIANGEGYIYVLSKKVSLYQSDENWSQYTSQIRALEEYTVDGTSSGDLDESKI